MFAIKDLANLALRIDALLDSGAKILATSVQRNLSPTASLPIYIRRLGISVKEKNASPKKGEALNFTFCAPNPDVGGRTTTGSDAKNIVLR